VCDLLLLLPLLQNILISRDGSNRRAKLADFGVSVQMKNGQSEITKKFFGFTDVWAAPEVRVAG
jgi:hypothetical protein